MRATYCFFIIALLLVSGQSYADCPAGADWSCGSHTGGGQKPNCPAACSDVGLLWSDPYCEHPEHGWVYSVACYQCNAGSIWISPVDAEGKRTGDPAACGVPEECTGGESLNPITGQCAPQCTDVDPITGECLDELVCPAGQEPQSLTVGTTTTELCAPILGGVLNDPAECENIIGYFNGQQVCGDDTDTCEAEGGTFGLVDDVETCIPEEYADDLPTCDSEGVVILVDGGFSCETPTPKDDSENPDVPETQPETPTDTDGDGTPNNNDSDIDGDGINNSIDPDIDGDGVLNEDDQTPSGEESSPEVSGGGSCEFRPSCTGDAIQCAILYQGWASRCESSSNSKVSGSGNCETGTPPTCQGDAIQCAILEQTFKAGCSSSGESEAYTQTELDELTAGNTVSALDLGTSDLTTTLSGIYSQTGATASCPVDDSITVAGTALAVSYTPFCDLAALIRPIVILLFSLIGFRTVMRSF